LLHWRLLIEEFTPELVYKPGVDNVVADSLSRLPLVPGEKQEFEDLSANLAECLLHYPDELNGFPLNFQAIAEAQNADPDVLALIGTPGYDRQVFHGTEMISYRRDEDANWRIVLPEALVEPALLWYHHIQGHSGADRLAKSLRTFFWIKNLKQRAEQLVSNCDDCDRNKEMGAGYGHLPARVDTSNPWEEVAVDLIGPWSVEVPMQGEVQIQALTVIDTATTLAEIIRIENKSSEHIALLFENNWLARYPRPLRCIHDQGGEFSGAAFQATLATEDIQAVPTTVKNPQSNAICERMHKTCGGQIRVLARSNPPHNVATAIELVDSVIASASRALRTAVHRTLGVSPGSLVFQRDMLLPIPLLSDFELIRERRQAIIDDNARRANLRRRFRDYLIGDSVLLIVKDPATLQERAQGPFTVAQVHVNGTVTIERAPGVHERINIRRIRPYRGPPL
jgi:transposase InsO family protein